MLFKKPTWGDFLVPRGRRMSCPPCTYVWRQFVGALRK